MGANTSPSRRLGNLDSASSTPIDLLGDPGQVPSFFLCLTQLSPSPFGKGSVVVAAAGVLGSHEVKECVGSILLLCWTWILAGIPADQQECGLCEEC